MISEDTFYVKFPFVDNFPVQYKIPNMIEEDVFYLEFSFVYNFPAQYQIPNIFKGLDMNKIIQILHPKGIENTTFSFYPRESKKHFKSLKKAKSNLRHFKFLGTEASKTYKILVKNGLQEGSLIRIFGEENKIMQSSFDSEHVFFNFFI